MEKDTLRIVDTRCGIPRKEKVHRSRVQAWRDAQMACQYVVQDFDPPDLKQCHLVFERWVPRINQAFDNPINLNLYEFLFYYCDEQVGPKEIVHFYVEENPSENGKTCVYVVFHVHRFRNLLRQYIDEYSRHNGLLVDEARGTVNASVKYAQGCGSTAFPTYLRSEFTWLMLFAFTSHAMAHLDAYDKYHHMHYDTHAMVRDSPFYKLVVYATSVTVTRHREM